MAGNRYAAALAALQAQSAGSSGSGGGGYDFSGIDKILADNAGAAKPKKASGGFNWKGALSDALNVITVPLHAVTAATTEGTREVGHDLLGKDYGANNPSLKNYLDMITKPSKEIDASDFISGNPDKGINKGLFSNGDKTPGGSILGIGAPGLVRAGVGMLGDVAADPLTGLGGVGEDLGKEALAREIAAETTRQATAHAAEHLGVDLSADAIKEGLATGGESADALGKLREAAAGHAPMEDVLQRGAVAASKARRLGIAGLDHSDIADFLTHDGETLADRGLAWHGVKLPGTDNPLFNKLGELKAAGEAKVVDTIRSGAKGVVPTLFEEGGKRALIDAARSGDPREAFDAIIKKAVRDTAGASERGLKSQWTKGFAKLTAKFSEDDFAQLPKALEGDQAAIAALDGKHEGVRALLDSMNERAKTAGLNIQNIADYTPREITPEGRALLGKMGLTNSEGRFSPLASFQRARTLLADGKSEFMGETLHGTTNAEVTKEVNEIALRKLTEVDPKAAEEFGGFFNPDIKQTMSHYIGKVANRVSAADASSRLYAAGIGNASRELVADPAATHAAAVANAAADSLDARAGTKLEQAANATSDKDTLERHLLGQRLGQTEASVAGAPVTSPVTDEQAVKVVAAAHADATANLQAARTNLQAVQTQIAKVNGEMSVAYDSLKGEVDSLQTHLTALEAAHATGSTNLPEIQRIQAKLEGLANEHATWSDRYDGIMQEALTGKRSDVVMPTSYSLKTVDASGNVEAVANGPWKVVGAATAWRNSPEIAAHVEETLNAVDAFTAIKGELGKAASGEERHYLWTQLMDELRIRPPGLPADADPIDVVHAQDAYVSQHIIGDPIEERKALGRIEKGLRGEIKRSEEEQLSAAKLAEGALRDPKTGLVSAPMYHSTSIRWAGDIPGDTTYENAAETLDGPGLYTSTDQSGQVALGKDGNQLSEIMGRKGYAVPERGGVPLGGLGKDVTLRQDGLEPTVMAYRPRDPATQWLPLDRAVGPEEVPQQLSDAMDHFYGGDWQDHFAEFPEQHDTPMGDMADVHEQDPVAAFILHDMAQYSHVDPGTLAAAHAVQFQGNGFIGEAYQQMRAAIKEATPLAADGHIDEAAVTARLKAYTDHLYDDFGIKGVTREGGQQLGFDVPHEHIIPFRPNDDLELVGKSDYSAAFAKKQIHEIASERAKWTDALAAHGPIPEDPSATRLELAAKRAELAATPKPVGPIATQRSEGAVRVALDQERATDDLLKSTVSDIRGRRAAHFDEMQRITSVLRSSAPVPPGMRASMESYVNDLRDAVDAGNNHEIALKLGNAQLQRVSALEEAAATASAAATDLHASAIDLRSDAAQLGQQRVEQFTQAYRNGLQVELKRGVGTPQDVADLLMGTEKLTTSEGMGKALKVWDKAVGYLKDWQIATPGFNVRNLIGGEFNNSAAGVSLESRYRFIRAWAKSLRGTMDTLPEEDRNIFQQIESIGRSGGQVQGEQGMGTHVLDQINTGGRASLNPLSRNGFWIRGTHAAGMDVDFYNRGTLAFHTLANGGSLDDAVANVNKYQFHFNSWDMSKTEQGARHVIPFYTWTRKNLPLQLEVLYRNPKIYARLAEAKTNIESVSTPDKNVPDYFSSLMGIRLPFTQNGGHLYSTADLPPATLQDYSSPGQTVENALGAITPLIKVPLEMKFGKQFFENIPLSSTKPVPVPLPALLIKGLAPVLESTGLARNVDGKLFMTEKNAYALEQFVPVLSRYRRLQPQEPKYQSKQLASVLSFLGFNVQLDSKAVQDSYVKGKKYVAQQSKSGEKAFVKAAKALAKGNS